MAAFAIDTSVIIAALLSWHDKHEPAFECLARLFAEPPQPIILPTRVLVESYSVLTRLPSPHRLSPEDSFRLLEDNFRKRAKLVSLGSKATWRWLESSVQSMIGGGKAYDAEIYECARIAKATHLVTLNVGHFEEISNGEIEILPPDVLRNPQSG